MNKLLATLWGLLFFTPFLWSREVLVPQELSAWKAWVLHDVEDFNSPQHYLAKSWNRQRVWPSFLRLNQHQQSIHFEMDLRLYDFATVELPGYSEAWPREILVNGKAIPLLEQHLIPTLSLGAGLFHITGLLVWDKAPTKLRIPPCCGVVSLTSEGQAVSQLNLDREGWLWFHKDTPEVKGEQDLIDIKVFRKIVDHQPLQVESLLLLGVSGKERVVEVGRFNPLGTAVMSLDSPLPARLEASGNLKIQLRSGQYRVKLESRYLTANDNLVWTAQSPEWPESEVWSFEAHRELRQVQLLGGIPIDPSQQEVPQEWKGFPCFLLTSGESLYLQETGRGEKAADKNNLKIMRQLWLDYDGEGMTFKDRISGSMAVDWRLNLGEDFQLGSVEVDGQPRMVSLSSNSQRGVELRRQNLRISALGRSEVSRFIMSASLWDHDLDQLHLTLHLPPAWDLLVAHGADTASGSWLERWTLWDVFLVLLLTVGLGKVLGPIWGGLAFAYLALAYHSPEAPTYIWFNFLVFLSILKVSPQGWWSRFFKSCTWIALGLLAVLSLRYGGQEIREVIYPQLAEGSDVLRQTQFSDMEENAIITTFEEKMSEPEQIEMVKEDANPIVRSSYSLRGASKGRALQKLNKNFIDAVQTGPGEPQWTGSTYQLSWKGPVQDGEKLTLTLLPPLGWKVVRGLRVILLLLLFFGILRQLVRLSQLPESPASLSSSMSLIFVIFLLLSPQLRAEMPSPELLNTYKERLIALPNHSIASVSSGNCVWEDPNISLNLTCDVQQFCYLPLLEKNNSFTLQNVLIDGKPAESLRCNEAQQWEVALVPGTSHITFVLDNVKEYVQMVFPVALFNFEVLSKEWSVRGLSQGFVSPQGSLQLERKSQLDIAKSKDSLLPDPVNPFVEVYRTIDLDRDWTVITRVIRLAPQQEAVHIQVAPLAGEKLLDRQLKLLQGLYQVDLSRNQVSMEWTSLLEKVEHLELTCSLNPALREHWVIKPSPLWRVKGSGVPGLKATNGQIAYRPRPGEVLQLQLNEAKSAPGQLKTIEEVKLHAEVGPKVSLVTLNLKVKSSLGGVEKLKVPENFELDSFTRDGSPQFTALSDGILRLPLVPGESNFEVKLKWLTPLVNRWESPVLEFESSLNNIRLNLDLPSDRWVLALGGPSSGPAVLIWGILLLMLLLAQLLPLANGALSCDLPLGRWQWSLLFAGFCTVTPWVNLLFVVWFLGLAWRRGDSEMRPWAFNIRQLACFALSLMVALAMIASIPFSLLGNPQMMIEGANSWGQGFLWYQDRSSGVLPTVWVLSLPLWVYRLSMLFWSLWLALAVFRWMKWAWHCFSLGGCWKSVSKNA